MKTSLLLTVMILASVRSFAGTPNGGSKNNGEGPTSLLSADQIICSSPGIGNFALINLKSQPSFVRNSKHAIVIESLKVNSIDFKYRDYEGYNYRITFTKKVQHQDIDNRMYETLAGSFQSIGGEGSYIECELK